MQWQGEEGYDEEPVAAEGVALNAVGGKAEGNVKKGKPRGKGEGKDKDRPAWFSDVPASVAASSVTFFEIARLPQRLRLLQLRKPPRRLSSLLVAPLHLLLSNVALSAVVRIASGARSALIVWRIPTGEWICATVFI